MYLWQPHISSVCIRMYSIVHNTHQCTPIRFHTAPLCINMSTFETHVHKHVDNRLQSKSQTNIITIGSVKHVRVQLNLATLPNNDETLNVAYVWKHEFVYD